MAGAGADRLPLRADDTTLSRAHRQEREAVLLSEEMVARLLAVTDRDEADELIPQEISVNPHQLALELEARQSERDR